MEEYPGNSKQQKQTPKKVEQVVSGEVIRKKKSPIRRARNILIGGDPREVWESVFWTIIVPSLRDGLTNAGQSAWHGLIHGNDGVPNRPPSRGSVLVESYDYGRTNYQKMSSKSPLVNSAPTLSKESRSSFNFDDIIFADRVKAITVLERLGDLVDAYDTATVADLYDLIGMTGDFTDQRYGWTSLRGAGVSRVQQGYLLNLPRPVWLKD